jgi:hypothetical protein
MTFDSRESASGRPPAVAVHDDRDVTWEPARLELLEHGAGVAARFCDFIERYFHVVLEEAAVYHSERGSPGRLAGPHDAIFGLER